MGKVWAAFDLTLLVIVILLAGCGSESGMASPGCGTPGIGLGLTSPVEALGLALLIFAFVHRDIPAYYWQAGFI